ncbi:BgTH12-07842 [Blumeria graminis f. sp. triticale]|uniref:BgTH12-04320 n=1 Tax=Blumeria graminis f. sp. triticale TaxID=1689686 RepID=A0A9W4DDW1_BLUGR|nr:BgTH12-04320 [Blumeria graminis f. sp. triticale]CAD6506610.1 BgTH12-07836 [Blumeria graminis f. sp. triticale]CAD6506612.1 BgTH12-07838 [Blumeria graminis f. sp. triticale]CAD6506616.1 BgTH12-07842 [Blumeria graminis f. sp. triticale]
MKFLTGVALEVIQIIAILSSVSEGRDFQCKSTTISDEDLESIRVLACNSLQTTMETSKIDIKSKGKEELSYDWDLSEPLVLAQMKDESISQVQLNSNCEITSIRVSSKENDDEICTKEKSIIKRQDQHVVCNGVTFWKERVERIAASGCENGVIDDRQPLEMYTHQPPTFSLTNHYSKFIQTFGKPYRKDYSYPSLAVFDSNCHVLGVMVKINGVFLPCPW